MYEIWIFRIVGVLLIAFSATLVVALVMAIRDNDTPKPPGSRSDRDV